MSGFGGGFGPPSSFGSGFSNTSNPQAQGFGVAPPFGQQQQQQQAPFGMVAPPQPPSNMNRPPVFGAPASFGAPAAPSSSLPFGTSPNSSSSGTIPSGGFGGNPMFGQPSTQLPFGQSSTTTMIGGFGQSTPATAFSGGGFRQTTITPFGSGAANTGGLGPFGTPPSTAQFGSSTATAVPTTNNPFGVSQQAPAPALSFGVSTSTVPPPASVNTNPFAGGGIGSTTTPSVFGTTSRETPPVLFGTMNNAPTLGPFGASSTTTTSSSSNPFAVTSPPAAPTFAAPASFLLPSSQQQSYEDDGMADADGDDDDDDYNNHNAAPASHLPFGRISAAPTTAGTVWSRYSGGTPVTGAETAAAQSTKSEAEEKLAQMKAKLAEKIRKKEEKKKREEAAANKKNNHGASTSLRADATVFLPGSNSNNSSSLAQRNAERFATSKDTDTRSQLPADLQDDNNNNYAAANNALRNAGGRADREYLENAVALVGVCEYMCPDEELLRRERESDIQLLERPVPDGNFHPRHWTLRDTMVKRFRRSAADYKLDVPEWVRPPDVLERVCGYLEEWVMERDRQGADPRYEGAAPPPLDVYQFIWDRTRMVRKDFILQNYVGTGGLCDARAVRCHERIARWHCMCEHQLSHIADFVTMQSQQNIQELGQTMKTLNQYYDDSMNRSLVEVPDENGHETRTDLSAVHYGCKSDLVQGVNPVDFDGTALVNATDSVNTDKRLIGKHGVGSPHHGTAEPEMRGLYILLTIDNDGGMEVLKYAGRLYQKRPEIYHSAPVQLALSLYKAKNDLNYARFFSILRSDSTPYLFACLMFKHVEHMRKYALYIMSTAYGGRSKDNEGLYDSYPLRKLTELLCYEDDDETMAACLHYGITVGTLDDIEGGEPTVYWKRSKFRQPKDLEKGTAILLQPRKMVKTIESKLKGATRLAVCRGEVGGVECFLSAAQVQARIRNTQGTASIASSAAEQVRAREAALWEWKQKEEERKKRQGEEEEARRKQEEEKRKKAEKLRHAEQEREQKLEERKRQIQLQEERERKERDERERERLENEQQELRAAQERDRVRQKAQEEERLRKVELERQEALRRQEDERRRAEEERKRLDEEERKRQEVQRQEEERKRLEHLRKQEEERKRLEEERIRREQERRRLEAEAYRLQQELKRRVQDAQKTLVWRRLVEKTKYHVVAVRTKDTLLRLNAVPQASTMSSVVFNHPATARMRPSFSSPDSTRKDLRRILESSLHSNDGIAGLGSLFAEKARDALEGLDFPTTSEPSTIRTFLFKIAVFHPTPSSLLDAGICGLVRAWINTRLGYDKVHSSLSSTVTVKIVFVDMWTQSTTSICDAALLVIPPPWSYSQSDFHLEELKELASEVDENVPRAILALAESFELSSTHNERLLQILGTHSSHTHIARNSELNLAALDRSLSPCVDSMVEIFAKSVPRSIERITLDSVFYKCMNELIWFDDFFDKFDDLANCVRAVMLTFVSEVDAACSAFRQERSSWPSSEFIIEGKVSDYFGAGADLPANWADTTSRAYLSETLGALADRLSGPLTEVIRELIDDAPSELQWYCEDLYERRFYKRCIQRALLWRVQAGLANNRCQYLYLPLGFLDEAIRFAVASQSGSSTGRRSKPFTFIRNVDSVADVMDEVPYYAAVSRSPFAGVDTFVEEIDLPPKETPRGVLSPCTKRSWTDPSPKVAPPSLLEDTPASPLKTNKRQRRNSNKPTKELSESISYTKRLERLLNGDEMKDMMIPSFDQGSLLLSATLRGAPSLQTLD